MRTIDLSEVCCEACQDRQSQADWGRRCRTCANASFRVELERSASGLNGDNLLDALVQNALSGSGGGEVGLLIDIATDDVGGSGLYFSMHSALACTGVSFQEIGEFQTASADNRTRLYVAWKRREVELSLPKGHRICARCRVAFKVYANEWGQSGLCSKACYQAFLKSWSGDR